MSASVLLYVQEFLLFINLLLSDRVLSSLIASEKQILYKKKIEIVNLKTLKSRPQEVKLNKRKYCKICILLNLMRIVWSRGK